MTEWVEAAETSDIEQGYVSGGWFELCIKAMMWMCVTLSRQACYSISIVVYDQQGDGDGYGDGIKIPQPH